MQKFSQVDNERIAFDLVVEGAIPLPLPLHFRNLAS